VPPAKKKTSKKKTTLERGVALVDAVMAARRSKGETLSGEAPESLDTTTLGEKPLTPALRRWLEQDAEMFTLGEPQSFSEMVEGEFPEFAEFLAPVAELLTEPCVLFEGWGCDSRRFIYLGKVDEHGEYPVFTLDTDDVPFVCINGPVDVWLAQQAGYLEEEHVYGHVPPAYEPARRAHAQLNFGGFITYMDAELHEQLDPYGGEGGDDFEDD
jgi:hypothetical protein